MGDNEAGVVEGQGADRDDPTLSDSQKVRLELQELELDVRLKERQLAGRPPAWEIVKTLITWVTIVLAVLGFFSERRKERLAVRQDVLRQVVADLERRPRQTLEVLPLYIADIGRLDGSDGQLQRAVARNLIPLISAVPPTTAQAQDREWAEISSLAISQLKILNKSADLPSDVRAIPFKALGAETSQAHEALGNAFDEFVLAPASDEVKVAYRQRLEDLCRVNSQIHELIEEVPQKWCDVARACVEGDLAMFRKQCMIGCPQGGAA